MRVSFQLNENQSSIVAEAVDWYYNSSEQVFEFDGEAGTGKSVTLYEAVKAIGIAPSHVMAMAFTGQAAIVMRMKGFPYAKSIHSQLFKLIKKPKQFKDSPFLKVNSTFNSNEYEYQFVPLLPGEIDPKIELMVIDEGWMVPGYMRETILQHGIKVIVAGDSGQLPPIGDGPAFLTGYNVRHLTELMRQAYDNPIVYLAHRARRGQPIHCGVYGSKAMVIEESDFTQNMLMNIGNIICGTNKTRDYFNNLTRKCYGIESGVPTYGERIICRNNNWHVEQDNIALANGLAGTVVSPCGVDSFVGKNRFRLDFLPDLLNSPFKNLELDYSYITAPYDVRNQMKNSKFENGEKFEFAYALTTHLSQGAEFPYGIYYEEFLRSNIQNQLNYTAITRFKEYLIYVKKNRRVYY